MSAVDGPLPQKICRSCGESKSKGSYNLDSKSPDRLHRDCRACVEAKREARRAVHPQSKR